jgi:L-amino acid N-acyltransferase YncA
MGTKIAKRTYPCTERIGGTQYSFRLMTPDDAALLGQFTAKLPEDDLLFLRMDITKPEVIAAWADKVRDGRTTTLLAFDEKDKIVGYCSLHRSELMCTQHHGELRVFVHSKVRGVGLGQFLVSEIHRVARERHLERITMNIAREQAGLRQMLEGMGFNVEALLTDWLKSRDGRLHDLVIMSYKVDE